MSNMKRNNFIDIAKGVAIFLMLWGHCIQYCVAGSDIDFFENSVFKTIYSFHMPLFMLISGYLFYLSFMKRDLKELLIYRTQALVQPIVFCSIFNFYVTTVLFEVISGDFYDAFNGKWLQNLSSLWFLWSVLIASVAVALVCKKVKYISVQIILFLVMIPLIATFPNTDLNLYMYPYFILGFYFAKYKDRLPEFVHNLKYLCVPLFPVLMCFYEKKHYIYTTGLFPNSDYSWDEMLIIDAYRWLIGLVGSVFVLVILQILYKLVAEKSKKKIVCSGLSHLGEKSIQVYTFSVPFLSVYLSKFFPKMLSALCIDNIFVNNMFIYNFVFTLLLSVLYSFVLYFFIKLFEKLKITKIMFGK